MNRITDVTREDIFHMIRNGISVSYEEPKMDIYERVYYVEKEEIVHIPYYGKLDYINFFKRIYNLDELPSTDSRFDNAEGDIWQHTINNEDWEWDWFLEYPPFNLSEGTDEMLLTFLAEIFHPAVRDERTSWEELLKAFNRLLKYDGYELYPSTKISGRDVYSYKELSAENEHIIKTAKEISEAFSSDYLNRQIDSMLSAVHENPSDAIGKAKELLESCCKTILENEHVKIESKWDLQRLTKETFKLLKLTPNDIEDEKRASGTIKQILGSLSGISSGMAELRNSYGSGHGKSSKFRGLSSRHANLAVGTSITAVRFIWETYQEQSS